MAAPWFNEWIYVADHSGDGYEILDSQNQYCAFVPWCVPSENRQAGACLIALLPELLHILGILVEQNCHPTLSPLCAARALIGKVDAVGAIVPGPWMYFQDGNGFIVTGPPHECVNYKGKRFVGQTYAAVVSWAVSSGNREGNARLVSAGPELLRILRLLVEQNYNPSGATLSAASALTGLVKPYELIFQ